MILDKWITRNELKVYGIVVAALSLTAILITVIVLNTGKTEQIDTEVQATDRESLPIDFAFPNEQDVSDIESSWARYRPVMEKWTKEQVTAHWIDPLDVGIEILKERNDRLITDIFQDIP